MVQRFFFFKGTLSFEFFEFLNEFEFCAFFLLSVGKGLTDLKVLLLNR